MFLRTENARNAAKCWADVDLTCTCTSVLLTLLNQDFGQGRKEIFAEINLSTINGGEGADEARCVDEGGQMTWQNQGLRCALLTRRMRGDGRNGLRGRPRGHFLFGVHAGKDAGCHDPRSSEQHDDANQLQMT